MIIRITECLLGGGRTFRTRTFRPRTFRPGHFQGWTFRPDLNFSKIHSDYLFLSLSLFIQYCFYHLTQSIWRKIQSLGLTNLYEINDDFRLFCGQIDALAFLPLHEVSELWRDGLPERISSRRSNSTPGVLWHQLCDRSSASHNSDSRSAVKVPQCATHICSCPMEYAWCDPCRPTKDQQCFRRLEQ